MVRLLSIALALAASLVVPARAAADATLFRLFLHDGTSVVSYGEFARVEDRVIFSTPIGGTPDAPRLHPVTLAAALIDWPRTDAHAESVRYRHYLETRAESDYIRMTADVAARLNAIALTTDRARALALAEEARTMLAAWPRAHYGYRQDDVRELVGLIDGAIDRLRGVAPVAFELALVATATPAALEAPVELPGPRAQLDQTIRLAEHADSARDRVALLQAALLLIGEGRVAGPAIVPLRQAIERRLRDESRTDDRYARLTRRLASQASRAAADADIGDVEKVLRDIPAEDAKLGRQRPEVVQALVDTVQRDLDSARQLRLLRDQWQVRQSIYREYQRTVGQHLLQLVKSEPWLEAIRRLDGPAPDDLAALRHRLAGGARQLERLTLPPYLRSTHDLLLNAWRFAERAAEGRTTAVAAGDLGAAWEASSAAAGALMLLGRAQQELRALIEPPRLP